MKRVAFTFLLTTSSQVDEVALFWHESRSCYYADFWQFWCARPCEGGGYAGAWRLAKDCGAEDVQPGGGPSALASSPETKNARDARASRAFESRTGAPSGIRTLDLGIKSPLLWPAELTARSEEVLYSLERREASTNFHSSASSRDAQICVYCLRLVFASSTTSDPSHRRPLPATQRSSAARMPGRNTRMSAMVHAAPKERVWQI